MEIQKKVELLEDVQGWANGDSKQLVPVQKGSIGTILGETAHGLIVMLDKPTELPANDAIALQGALHFAGVEYVIYVGTPRDHRIRLVQVIVSQE